MIHRQPIACDTCGQIHITRTGLGRSSRQEHLFACSACAEEIGFALWLDQAKGNLGYESWTNCHPVNEEPAGAPVVNLEADFLMPVGMQGVDGVFPRLQQLGEIITARENAGLNLFEDALYVEGARGGDAHGEWLDLRRAWSLTKNKQAVLAAPRIKAASDRYYKDSSLANLADWLFRLNGLAGGVPVQKATQAAASVFSSIARNAQFEAFLRHYTAEMLPGRGEKYFRVYNDFFNAYDDFNQLRTRLAAGLIVDSDLEVSSGQFARTRMFYGNAFEALGSLVDLIAFSNNVLQGREWDKFETLTAKQYLKLDKINRFNAFAAVPELAALSVEADNQLRNASHHGSMEIDSLTKVITYRAGKGGQGEARTISYTEYLRRCVVIFHQIIILLNVELLVTRGADKSLV